MVVKAEGKYRSRRQKQRDMKTEGMSSSSSSTKSIQELYIHVDD